MKPRFSQTFNPKGLNPPLPFPPDFVWGTATAAYQIEGAVSEDGRGESIWDRFSHTPGKTKHGHTGDLACDHYHLYKKDIALMKSLGINSYRFSISWPRIIPTGEGPVNQKGLDFYQNLVEELLNQGLTPYITLYHWDLPQALEDQGGWTSRETTNRFAEYTDVVSKKLGDRVKNWLTINEPWCIAMLGYYQGVHAPGRKSFKDALSASHHTLLAHAKALAALKANIPDLNVGIALNLSPVYPLTASPEDQKAAKLADGYLNRLFLDPLLKGSYPQDLLDLYSDFPQIDPHDLKLISKPLNFLGVNYYMPILVTSDQSSPLGFQGVDDPHSHHTNTNWLVSPNGLFDLLLRLKTDYSPTSIFITENGACYEDTLENGTVKDPQRSLYFKEHLKALNYALGAQIPLKGYFLWSLLDNFEWAEGFTKRFGLFYTDFPTQKRFPKQSVHTYSTLISK